MKKIENRVAQSKPSDFSLGLTYEFCAEFGRQGGNPDLLQELIENKGRMVRAVAIARGDNVPKGYELANLILGDDFISPEEVANAYGVSYTEDQLKHFGDTLPDEKTLQWYRTHGYMLVAGPSTELNLLEVRELDNKLFYSKTEGWYAENKHTFAREDKVACGEWLAIRKDEVPNSLRKTWKEQQDLITEVEHVPNASEVSYAVTAYFKVRGIYLFRGKYVRTSSVSADGYHVVVGDFDGDGLVVSYYYDGNRYGGIGVASARK